MKTSQALNSTRSAKEPEIRAGVMMANLSWKIAGNCHHSNDEDHHHHLTVMYCYYIILIDGTECSCNSLHHLTISINYVLYSP